MKRVCLEPGCPTLVDAGLTRCPTHQRARDRARGTSTARGYGYTHQRTRAGYAARMAAGEVFACWRCGATIDPLAWDLGHDDHDRTVTIGPECRRCNRSTATRRDISSGG